ncbi:MAG: MtnX-like HAD-IB family phosphatase [Deltaproteobacteria bacterium]|nr:MtnX-like HAD-IB family phosphatase [Candidatus Zymogenaceae bacterium]
MLSETLKHKTRPVVACDFDGTISVGDVSYQMLQKFSHGGWEDIDVKYINGEIGSREAFSRILERLNATKQELERSVPEMMTIDPGFGEFYRIMKERGVDVVIVSDGFKFYIDILLEREGLSDIPIYANDIEDGPNGRLVPLFPHHNDECDRCGNCKRCVIKELRNTYDYVVYAGDGYSDRCPAQDADTLFAKKYLYRFAAKNRIPAFHFNDFSDVLRGCTKSINGVIFDLDETLVNSLDAIRTSFNHTIDTLGVEIDREAAFKEMMHWPLNVSMENIFPNIDVSQAVKIFREKYYAIYKEMTPVKNGIGDILEGLKARGIGAAIATNKHGPYARELVKHLGIDTYFVDIIGAGDVKEPKPAPDMIEAALTALGTDREHAVFVGDSIVDVTTAKHSDIDIYALAESIHTPEELAHHTPTKMCHNTLQLKEALLGDV